MEAISIDEIIRKTVAECLKQTHPDNPSGTWVCPVCRNWYALDGGSLICMHDKSGTCKCPDMPAGLRRIRDLDLLERAVTLCPEPRAEKLEALARIVEALHGKR